jgi:hypothetical protein
VGLAVLRGLGHDNDATGAQGQSRGTLPGRYPRKP